MKRRAVLKGAAAWALPLPAIAAAAPPSEAELIAYHAEALRDLVRRQGPAEATRIAVHVRSGPQRPDGSVSVAASFSRDDWSADPRLERGGLWVTRSLAEWELGLDLVAGPR